MGIQAGYQKMNLNRFYMAHFNLHKINTTPRVHHELKTETEYYQAVEKGLKTFELRKNDRDFKVGDILTLKETVNGIYTGRELTQMEIKYILHGGKYGLEEGYCIICW